MGEADLILNKDGSIYHLGLLPGDIADTILTVGDPHRVPLVSKHFDTIEVQKQKREFVTHTGYLNNKRLTVISTGMGAGNIDIFMNELDALVNIDLAARKAKETRKSLEVIRLGTSGAVDTKVEVDSILLTQFAFGTDTLMHFYDLQPGLESRFLGDAFTHFIQSHFPNLSPYACAGDSDLLKRFLGIGAQEGNTVTCEGFYGPQGRHLLTKHASNFVEVITDFSFRNHTIQNLEMETAPMYALGKLLGHRCLSVNAILANRNDGTFSRNPAKGVESMIERVLETASLL